jgi:putative heme-binding domain-containing protein
MPANRIPSAFTLDLSYRGTASDGRKVFDTDAGCAACHALGGPQKLGPTLSTIGSKYDKQAMLDNIINPSDAVGPEYITTMFSMKSGDTVAGLVVGETAAEITVQTSADQQQRLKPADIASRQQIRVSPMPEGLLSGLSLQQIADLLEFLSTLK